MLRLLAKLTFIGCLLFLKFGLLVTRGILPICLASALLMKLLFLLLLLRLLLSLLMQQQLVVTRILRWG